MNISIEILFLLLFVNSVYMGLNGQTRYYVDVNQTNDPSDGLTWNTAFDSLQQAIDIAVDGDTIWVAAGIYFPTTRNATENVAGVDLDRCKSFLLKSGVKIFGGFQSGDLTFDDRDYGANETILSGDLGTMNDAADNATHVIYIDNDLSVDTELDGFTIADGNANESFNTGFVNGSGGGIGIFSSDYTIPDRKKIDVFIKIKNILFQNNRAESGGVVKIFSYKGSLINPSFENCIFENNYAGVIGSCLSVTCRNIDNDDISEASPNFINCLLKENTSQNGRGAMEFSLDSRSKVTPNIKNCVFYNNVSSSGTAGAVYLSVGNRFNSEAWLDFENCTFSDNIAPNTSNTTFWMTAVSGVTPAINFDNCIFSNQSTDTYPVAGSAGIYRFSHTMVDTTYAYMESAFLNNVIVDTSASGMIFDKEAEFVEPSACDFGLMITSPAINRGVDDSVTVSVDLLNNPRIENGRVDMGAVEYQGFIAFPVAKCQNIEVNLDENGCASITPEEIDNGSERAESLNLNIMDFKCDDIGQNRVTLTAANQLGNSMCDAIVTVNEGDAPIPNITGRDTSICIGSSVDFADLIDGTVIGSLTYREPNGDYRPLTPVAPSITTTYFIRDSSASSRCVDTAEIRVTVNPLPLITGRDTTVCMGAEIDLSTLIIGTPVNMLEYGDMYGVYNLSSLVTVNATSTYYIRDSSAITGCVDTTTITINTLSSMECLMSFSSANELTFGDPCICESVILEGSEFYFRDTLIITTEEAVDQINFLSLGSSAFYQTPGVPMPDGTPFIQMSPSMYKLEFYKLNNTQATGFVSVNNSNTPVMIPAEALQVCSILNCPELIPTMGQWGLIILALMMLILGVVSFRKKHYLNQAYALDLPHKG